MLILGVAVKSLINAEFLCLDLALMSYECEAPETQFEKERRKSLRLVETQTTMLVTQSTREVPWIAVQTFVSIY